MKIAYDCVLNEYENLHHNALELKIITLMALKWIAKSYLRCCAGMITKNGKIKYIWKGFISNKKWSLTIRLR